MNTNTVNRVRCIKLITFLIPIALLMLPTLCFAEQRYEHGHGAMQIFDAKGMENTPQWVMIWISFMLLTFASSLLFVKNHSEARWVVGGFLAGTALILITTRGFGMPALSGLIALMHLIGWSPALFILLKRRPFLGPVSAFSIWSGVMTFVIIFSFIFDIRDAAIFINQAF